MMADRDLEKDSVAALLQRTGPHTALTLVSGRETKIRWTYAELQSQRLYCQLILQSCDVEPGDRVVVITHNLPQFFALLLATLAMDLCLLPLHPDFAKTLVLGIIERQKPRLIIVDESIPLPTWLAHAAPMLFRLSCHNQHWLREVLDTPLRSQHQSIDGAGRRRGSLLFHSSGTTGAPKAVHYTRDMLNNFLRLQRHLYAAFPDDATSAQAGLSDRVNVLPVTHWGGLSFCLQTLLEGRTLHLLQSGDPRDHLQLLRETRCQLLLLVPAVAAELLAPEAELRPLPALRHCLTMGESVSNAQLEQLSRQLGLCVQVAYGMSECLSGLAHRHESLGQTPTGSCGRLLFGEVKLVSSDGCDDPVRGELWVRNESTVPCYLDAQLLRQKYVDRWYRTGDVFTRDPAGHYFFEGRVDSMCVINGRNIFPREVEAVLLRHPAVAECVVAPINIGGGSHKLAAMVVIAAGKLLDANSLLDFYMQHGAVFATPVCIEFRGSLPRNAGDKYDRQGCAAQLQQLYDSQRPGLHAKQKHFDVVLSD